MKIGVVGKPNVGKSAFFRSCTLSNAESGDFPFTTIDANCGVGYVKIEDPAKQFGKVSNPKNGFVREGFRFVPIEIVDVAGLVPGASEGVGLGNKFLDDLRQADCLIHVIDLSGSVNEKGESCGLENYNPEKDVEFLEKEIDNWFFQVVSKNFSKIEKKILLQHEKISDCFYEILSGLNISIQVIEKTLEVLNINSNNLKEKLFEMVSCLRKFSKPMIIACNKCDLILESYEKKIKELEKKFPNYMFVPIFAEYEFNLRKADEKKIIKYISGDSNFEILEEDKLNLNQKEGLLKIRKVLEDVKNFGVQKVLNCSVFDLLKLKPIFPGGANKLEDSKGNVIPDCFLMEEKATALDFAYKLHTDFGKNFIKAIDVKTKRMVGKEHILNFSDIIEIVSGK